MEKSLHIKESNLELFVYRSGSFSEEESDKILSHLDNCSYCKDIYESYRNLYHGIDKGLGSESDENDKELAESIIRKFEARQSKKLLPEGRTAVQIYDNKVEIVTKPKSFSLQYFIFVARNYPVQSIVFTVIAALALAFITNSIKSISKDENPFYTENEKNFLMVYNKQGELLFKKPSFGIPNLDSKLLSMWEFGGKKFIEITDVDNDNINEILLTGSSNSGSLFSSDSLYCFNNSGDLLWVTLPEVRNNPKAPDWHRTKLRVQEFFAVNYGSTKKLFVISKDANYAGALITELDVHSGKPLHTLYFAGWASVRLNLDIDNDGKSEIIICGGDTFNKPFIMVLKTDNIKGVMPDYHSLNKNFEKGSAYYYVQLYFNLLGKYDNHFLPNPNVVTISKLGKDGFEIVTAEYGTGNNLSGIQYAFDNKITAVHIASGSEYMYRYNNLVEKGLIIQILDSNYYKMLKDSIKYWDGDRFVKYPTKNKYFTQKF